MSRWSFPYLLAALFTSITSTSAAQVGQAKEDGKRFAASIAERAQAATKVAPTSDVLPGYGGTPGEAHLFDNPDAIAPAAAAAAATHEGYRSVRSSFIQRPRIDPVDIEATIARSQGVAEAPMPYVSGMGISGGQGLCRELPPSIRGAGFYEATCNSGVALSRSLEACQIDLAVTVSRSTAYRYWCSDFDWQRNGVDDCAALVDGSCAVTGTHPGRCLQGTQQNCVEPGEPIQEMLCDEAVPQAKLIGTETKTRITDARDTSGCATWEGDQQCQANPETCTSSDPQTRMIDGVAVTRPCWSWSKSYACVRKDAAQDCDQLESDATCRFVRQTCLTEDDPCTTWERIYRCPLPDPAPGPKQYICDSDVYCIAGECETIDREPNREFGDAVLALNTAGQAGREFDPDSLSLFKGERSTCKKAVFGLLNCCAGKAFPLIPYGQLLVALGCGREEILLHQRDAQGLCAFVGSYCSESLLGVCLTKKKTYCCFQSKLSRILQEQGRPQIGLGWDHPRRETCRGFTIEEFARLDLSRMDFTEVFAEFEAAAKLPDELATVDILQRRIEEYFARGGAAP